MGRLRVRKAVRLSCQHCGNPYHRIPAKVLKSRFCSFKCKVEALKKPPIICVCQRCARQFLCERAEIARGSGTYCSKQCCKNRPKERNCEQCGQAFTPHHNQQVGRFCSSACKNAFQVGENNPNFKGAPAIKYGWDWTQLRAQVLERDGYTCQACFKDYGKMHVHHIIPYSVCRSHEIENLVTLCAPCHKKYEVSLPFADRDSARERFLYLIHAQEGGHG